MEMTVKGTTEELLAILKVMRKYEDKKSRELQKEFAKKAEELRSNFKTMGSCMIHPKNIKLGSLEKCIYSNVVPTLSIEDFAGIVSIGHIDEKYEPIEGEKVLVELEEGRGVYFDIDKVNNIFDLYQLRKQINDDLSITLGEIFLDCYASSKIRINSESLRAHPRFEGLDTPISLKQLKKELTCHDIYH